MSFILKFRLFCLFGCCSQAVLGILLKCLIQLSCITTLYIIKTLLHYKDVILLLYTTLLHYKDIETPTLLCTAELTKYRWGDAELMSHFMVKRA